MFQALKSVGFWVAEAHACGAEGGKTTGCAFPGLWESREAAGVIHVSELPAEIPCSASSSLSRHFCRAGLSASQLLESEGLQ